MPFRHTQVLELQPRLLVCFVLMIDWPGFEGNTRVDDFPSQSTP